MKVALVVPGGVDRSGERRVIPALLALIGRLSAQHEVHVFALAQESDPGEWELLGARIHNIGVKRSRPRAIRAIVREHRSAPFDVVHSIWAGACGLVAVSAAAILRIPSLVHIAGGELVCVPEIGYGGTQTWRGRVREALILRAATLVTAASTPIIEAIHAHGVQARRVPLGVDLHAWPRRAPLRRDVHAPARLIHVGSLNPVKDQTTLLHALAALAASGANFRMDIVGEDTLGGRIQALAGQLGLALRVQFHGFLTQRQLRPLMEEAHLMIVSSRHEAGPIAMLEAAVVGVPTVGTRVGHVAEWAPAAALDVRVGDAAQMAAAVASLLQDEDRRLRLAHAAFERAAREDADHTVAEFQSLYRLVQQRGADRRDGLHPRRPA